MILVALTASAVMAAPAYAMSGGAVAHAADYSYIAALQYTENGNAPHGLCQGALVRQDVVVTAAHCIFNSAAAGRDVVPSEVSVWLGADSMRSFGLTPPNAGAELYAVRTIKRDAKYKGDIARGHDVAVLQLERPAAPRFRPLPLVASANSKEAKKNSAYVAEGYMNNDRSLQISSMQGVDLPLRCSLKWFADSIYVKQKGVKLIEGDSGGGLTAAIGGATTLVGVLSGSPDAVPAGGCPDAFTDLRNGPARKWLDDQLGSLPPVTEPPPTAPTETLTYTRTSVSSAGVQGTGESSGESISGDGTLAVFHSRAANLVPSDTNATYDVFVRNISTGQTTRVSTSPTGAQANGPSSNGQLSRDGRKVIFGSTANNLVPNVPAGTNLYVKDLATGAVAVASSTAANLPVAGSIGGRFVDRQGTLVLLEAQATDLVPGTADSRDRLYLKNLVTGAVSQVSLAGDTGNMHNIAGYAITPDGSKLAYSYRNGEEDGLNKTVYLRNMGTGDTTSVVTANNDNNVWDISEDGTKIAFDSFASDLVPGDTNGTWDAFSVDVATGRSVRVSTASNGAEGNGASGPMTFTPDGAAVVFSSAASNLVASDANGQEDLFRKNLTSGVTDLLSVPLSGALNDGYTAPGEFSDDGKVLAVRSQSSKLVPGDTNGVLDAFVLRFG
jgi:Tol biopolymer transport system component